MIVEFRGFKLDDRTVAMVKWAEKVARRKLTISQGSYNKGGVAASAGTHDGGGVVDFSVSEYSPADLRVVLKALKDAGFACWYRPIRPGVWNQHIHAVAIGCKDLAPIAKRQVVAFDAKRDGLASNARDYSYRPKPAVVFDEVKGFPVPRKKKVLASVRTVTNRMRVE